MRVQDAVSKRLRRGKRNSSALRQGTPNKKILRNGSSRKERVLWSRSEGIANDTPVLGPNAVFVGMANARPLLWTPALILDLDALEHNLDTMAMLANRAGKNLRPHAKTHKSVRIARKQLKRGAVGISVATVHEASVMVRAGIKDVLVTSPVAGKTKLDAVAALAEQSAELLVVVDSMAGVSELETTLQRLGRSVRVLVDIDVGMRRTGTPNVTVAAELAARVAASSTLQFCGLQCYSGEAQHIPAASKRAAIYKRELMRLEAVLERLAKRGLTPEIVSGGGTGTAFADMAASLFTELQVGSYIFMDNQYNDVELFRGQKNPFKTSLFVQSMVLSNNHPRIASVDAGFKSFSLDGPLPRVVRGAPRGSTFRFYGDEFGLVRLPGRHTIELGSKIEFVTPHCDPTVNLHDYYHCVRGERLVDIWPVDARGPLPRVR